MNTRGFSLLETLAGGTLFLVLLVAATGAVTTDAQTHRILVGQLGPEVKARAAIDRIATEVRLASRWGEDANQDGLLDDLEDANGNGLLESDFVLGTDLDVPNPGVPVSTFTFNERVDLKDAYGETLAAGAFSEPVTYALEDNQIVKSWETVGADGVSRPRKSVLADQVSGLRFTSTGNMITVSMDVLVPGRAGDEPTFRTFTRRVRMRN